MLRSGGFISDAKSPNRKITRIEMKSILDRVEIEFANSEYWTRFFNDKEIFEKAILEDFYGVDELTLLQEDLKNRMN